MFCIVSIYLLMYPICQLPRMKLQLQGDKDEHASYFHGTCTLVEKADIKKEGTSLVEQWLRVP